MPRAPREAGRAGKAPSAGADLRAGFVAALDALGALESLFENVPNLLFWVKDREGRFVVVNQNLAQVARCRDRAEAVGKTDFDVYPKHIADAFRRDDLEVMRSGRKIVDRIEPIAQEDGSMGWYSTNKVPVYARDGALIGVAGTTRRIDGGRARDPAYGEFAEVLEHVNRELERPIEVGALARMTGLSLSQFERRFKAAFHETPVGLIQKLRVNEACRLLVGTRLPVAAIARATGFADAGYFSKRFARAMGVSPGRYREAYYQGS